MRTRGGRILWVAAALGGLASAVTIILAACASPAGGSAAGGQPPSAASAPTAVPVPPRGPAPASGPAAAPPAAPPAPPPKPEDVAFFENKVRPILVEQCYGCHSHGADKIKGGLMLDSRVGVLLGGETGPAVVPGNPDASLLIHAVLYTDEDLQMPPKAKLPDGQIADLREWIRRGAPDSSNLMALGSSASYGGTGRQHWSFLPLRPQPVPTVSNPAWCRTPVDAFILAKLDAAGLKPNPPADRHTLIRRVTFDLTGLPPTQEEVQAFVDDPAPDAYVKVVDRLLASPRYGERWGRYWLDVARYADTKGDMARNEDPRYPYAWTYRDWVIDAFNSDKPFNQFIVEQLAGDRLVQAAIKTAADPKTVDARPLAALGFLTLGNRFENRVNDIVDDRIDVTSKGFLGLTVTCARCHDHKFDPIPTKDYYALYGVFANTYEPRDAADVPWLHPVPQSPELVAYLDQLRAAVGRQDKSESDLAMLKFERLPKAQRAQMRKGIEHTLAQESTAIADLECSPAAPPKTMALFDVPDPRDYPVLLRGEVKNEGPIVPRHFLTLLSPDPKDPLPLTDGSGRLQLAEDIASPQNPLTARVLVNRVWQQHFGEGFVPTPDDLGNQSAPPTHPELLDTLALGFMQDGWSIKRLHRLIVLSSTYQESGDPNDAAAVIDPEDKLHWRYAPHSLDFEEVHDSILQIAGTLDLKQGGPPVPIGSGGFASRRAVYAFIDRRNPAEILTQFNYPNPNAPTGRRFKNFVPQQQLFLMNSPFVIETSRKLTHAPAFLALPTDGDRVAALFMDVYQRPPSEQETGLCIRYVESTPGGASSAGPAPTAQTLAADRQAERQAQQADKSMQRLRAKNAPQVEPGAAAFRSRAPLDAWTKLAHALFQTNEAMFVD